MSGYLRNFPNIQRFGEISKYPVIWEILKIYQPSSFYRNLENFGKSPYTWEYGESTK